jgi:eukaryotic-like serine/threonine-protein kinase
MNTKLTQQDSFARLANLHTQGIRRLIAFSGAGASKEVGFPDWTEFIGKLLEQYEQHATGAFGTALVEKNKQQILQIKNPWKRVEQIKQKMGGYFETAVRNILDKPTRLSTFYEKIWEISPSALLSVNLDGMAQQSWDARKTGVSSDYYTGNAVTSSRNILGSAKRLIVDLHGNANTPSSWILTESDLNKLMSQESYKQFLRNIFSDNIILFYGITFDDISISGQLQYLKQIGFVSGEYFLLKRGKEATDWNIITDFPIQIIYLDDSKSWESGFSEFIQELKSYRVTESRANPVISTLSDNSVMPSSSELLTLNPDEIRYKLNTAKNIFEIDHKFNYAKFKSFCKEYDSAIHLATRVSFESPNNMWLGKRITGELGKGNFGKVYSAEDEFGTQIAIKIAHPDVRDDEAMLDSFRRGVESMKILSESNIEGVVGIRDASELPPSIIMNFVQGIDFEKYALDYFDNKVDQKLLIINWICEILFKCHTHERFVLHRDLRPSNVMISGEYWTGVSKNQINILDFDLSWYKGASGSEFYMNAAQALGYLAPEQLNSKSKFSTRSALVDVYGVAMLLYFILSRDVPLANASTRTDWRDRVTVAARRTYLRNWRSASLRVFQLIVNATLEEQPERPSLQEFMEEIEVQIAAQFGEFPFDPYSVLLELTTRISGRTDFYQSDPLLSRTNFQTAAGVLVELSADHSTISCVLEYTSAGTSERTGRGSYLKQSLDRAKSALKGVCEIDEKRTGVELGRSILAARAKLPDALKEVDLLEERILRSISELPLRN